MAWAPLYITVNDLADFENITDAAQITAETSELTRAVTAASRAVDRHCSRSGVKRQFGKVASVEERFYTPCWSSYRGRWVCYVDDFQTATGLVVNLDLDGDGTYDDAVTGSRKLPLNAQAEGLPWTRLVLPESVNGQLCGEEGEVSVTALWGWTTVPVSVEEATLLQASRFYNRSNAPFGVAGSIDTGSEMRLLAKVDPDVAVSLAYYRRDDRVTG
jgi:hypothetical protein